MRQRARDAFSSENHILMKWDDVGENGLTTGAKFAHAGLHRAIPNTKFCIPNAPPPSPNSSAKANGSSDWTGVTTKRESE
jgi:hypothetical protein